MKNNDLSKGHIIRQLILFSVPLVLGELLQNLYNSVDALVVGNFVGTIAQAAVSVCETPALILVGFFNGMGVGASVMVSRAFGQGDWSETSKRMRVAFSFSVLLGVALSCVGILCAPLLLRLTAVDADIFPSAVLYLRIYMAGLMFTIIYNIAAGILRALGNSKTPFQILLVTCCVNIALDLLLVKVCRLGVTGVGTATVLSQGLSVVLAYRKLRQTDADFSLSFKLLRPNGKLIVLMLSVGLPSGIQNSLIFLSNLFVWRYINHFNAAAVAGVGIAQRLDKFIGLPCKALGLAVTTFVGQNAGAGDYRRCRAGTARALALSLTVVTALSALVYTCAAPCVTLFNPDPQVIRVGVAMMSAIIPFYCTMSIREVLLGALRGYGNARTPMLLSLIGMIAVRQIFLAVVMNVSFRIEFIYYCYPVAWCSTALLLAAYYLLVRKRYMPDVFPRT